MVILSILGLISFLSKYVDNTNNLIAGTHLEGADLVTILREAHDSGNNALFNNAAQAYNHEFYFNSIKPEGPAPEGRLLELINEHFGTFDKFRAEFVAHGLKMFGSGWCVLFMTRFLEQFSCKFPLVGLGWCGLLEKG
jgi:Fe-Mn family superoxide dismutase